MAADEIVAGDSGPDMARYHELINKANLLYGQGQKVAEVAGTINALIAGISWEGKRATRFRKEWDETNSMLSNWANNLVRLSEDVKSEAENHLVE